MASLQQRTVKGRKYWYIVESRRVNGKPRPVVLEYLGTADRLLERLNQPTKDVKLKSYQFGDVAALLRIAQKLNVVQIINKYIHSTRKGYSEKPIRNNLTAGATFLLAAIGRCCIMTSKRGWYEWAKTTSLEYLLSSNFSKLDSQHFWDMMDALPEEHIEKVEEEILLQVSREYGIQTDTLFYDTTNFYTFISTSNSKNTIAQRGKNKQKRNDLRQVGMALVVSREDQIPLFHHSYPGNLHDSKEFKNVLEKIERRLKKLKLNIARHTFVLDRGNNSKANFDLVEELNMFYVGGLSPVNHKGLTVNALQYLHGQPISKKASNVYRVKTEIWEKERTLVFFISDQLKQGQIRGTKTMLTKIENQLEKLRSKLLDPKSNKRKGKQLREQINKILAPQKQNNLITWTLKWKSKGRYELNFERNSVEIEKLEQTYGLRIIMSNRHEWTNDEIIQAYYGQSNVEKAFKELKNPYHLTVKPQYHWTDQKIKIHHFICVLAYLLSSLLYRQAKEKINYQGSINSLLNELENIRLASILSKDKKTSKIKAVYQIEEMTQQEKAIFETFNLQNIQKKKIKIAGVGVYK